MDGYAIVRIYYKGEAETHSVEYRDTLLDAQQRFFNIVAADLANADITYQACYIIDANGLIREGRVFDRRPPQPEPESE